MNPILKKLKLGDESLILIINPPEEYGDIMKAIAGEIHREIKGKYKFIQIFARSIEELSVYAKGLTEALDGDGYLWICYPKGTSKKYKSNLNRDKLAPIFGEFDFEPVTLVAIDSDWSALRVKNVDNIKSMKRKSAFTEKGKERIKGNEGC